MRFDNFIVLESSRKLLNVGKDILFIFLYIPPHDSPAYAQTIDGVGVELIENCLSLLFETRELLVFMCGDFNARTGQENGKGPLDSLAGSGEDEYVFERSSQDLGSNAFGAVT